jgi:hypothetical protein
MRTVEPISDPAFAPILLTIESIIHFMDEAALRTGVVWSDTQVIGIMQKVAASAKGHDAKLDFGESLRDQLLRELYERLVQTPTHIFEEIRQSDGSIQKRPLRKLFWIGCLNTVVHAARLRKSPFPGTRRYLDYLKVFITHTHPS